MRWTVIPHVSAHMHLKVTLGGECFSTDSTFEWFLSSVHSIMDFQGTTTGEWLVAQVTHMLDVGLLTEWRIVLYCGSIATTVITTHISIRGDCG